MNGELIHMIRMVSRSNAYIKTKVYEECTGTSYESIKFYVPKAPRIIDKVLGQRDISFELIGSNELEWQKFLVEHGVTRIILDLRSISSDDINLGSFANGLSKWRIITISLTGNKAWYKKWIFDNDLKKWHIKYFGFNISDEISIGSEGLKYHIDALDNSLKEVSEFAKKIDYEYWSEFFSNGRDILHSHPYEKSEVLPSIYSVNSHVLLQSIYTSWGFGGMGSWNDSPPYTAHTLGLDDEYSRVTNQLYENFIGAIEEAVNEF